MPIKKHRTPMPKWLAEIDIKFERPKKSATSKKSKNKKPQTNQAAKSSPKIKTVSIEAKCSCEGENENCFREPLHNPNFRQIRACNLLI